MQRLAAASEQPPEQLKLLVLDRDEVFDLTDRYVHLPDHVTHRCIHGIGNNVECRGNVFRVWSRLQLLESVLVQSYSADFLNLRHIRPDSTLVRYPSDRNFRYGGTVQWKIRIAPTPQ